MDYNDFMVRLQEYYGPYVLKDYRGETIRGKDGKAKPSKIGGFVFTYLREEINEAKLERLLRYIQYSHPVNYGPPDIAAIERAINEAIKNNRGADVHRINAFSTGEIDPKEKARYNAEARKAFSDGTLLDQFKEKLREKNISKARRVEANH